MVFSINFDFVGYLVHFEVVYYPALWDHIICFFVINPLLNYNQSAVLSISYYPSLGFYPRRIVRADSFYMCSMYLWVLLPVLVDIFIHVDSPPSSSSKSIFCISVRLGLTRILLMRLSVSCFIITPPFFNFYFQVFVYTYFTIFFDLYVVICWYCHIN